ncbi:MAG: DNA translocase FtsK 4TM domain-containing protein [Desulfuromonadales bacterium]|nr:DNA translocase FtsK 4TM domain-containing protein [Desulfuromonadales bacterium]
MSEKSKTISSSPLLQDPLHKEIAGVLLGAFGLYLALILLSYHGGDPRINNNIETLAVENLGGQFGAYLSDILYQSFGFAALLLPAGFFAVAWRFLRFRDVRFPLWRFGAYFLLLLGFDGLLALFLSRVEIFGQSIGEAGGLVGRGLADLLVPSLGQGGAFLILFPLFVIGCILSSRVSFVLFVQGRLQEVKFLWARRREQAKASKELAAREHHETLQAGPRITPPRPVYVEPPSKAAKRKQAAAQAPVQEVFTFLEACGTYHLPPLSLLDHEGEAAKPVDREALLANARILETKFADFNVSGEVTEVKPGPVVTMYEFAPAPGVKVNRISNLSDDLSMALRALSIRIVAPIPGRGVVGIEIPNRERETVWLKDIFSSDEFQKNGGRLPLALGKDIFGSTVVADLSRMPHVLVAGSTGSGKSVSINTMVLSLLYRAKPEDVRIIMVDPKMLELSIYEGIPHLLLPVVTNPKKAVLALAWAVREMERRYRLLSDKKVRDIAGYNKKIAKEADESAAALARGEVVIDLVEPAYDPDEALPIISPLEGEVLEHGHLPYIVVIVDELADLMMVAGRDIEESIARLAQMARAAGIHLILATQRPSVDVITGLIKANFPTRISFKVFSRIDSRTILDQMGAENLLGMGDMLYLPPGTGALQRVHGAFVSEIEVQRVVEFLKKQGEPVYDKSILEAPPSSDGGSDGDSDGYDEKWDEAIAVVADTRQASGSMLQRRLGVGYNRAMKMIERMEQEGIVGPSMGNSKPREVFISKMTKE